METTTPGFTQLRARTRGLALPKRSCLVVSLDGDNKYHGGLNYVDRRWLINPPNARLTQEAAAKSSSSVSTIHQLATREHRGRLNGRRRLSAALDGDNKYQGRPNCVERRQLLTPYQTSRLPREVIAR